MNEPKIIRARFASACPQCNEPIAVGDPVAKPTGIRNRAGGDHFGSCWYCVPCATDFQALGDLGQYSGANFLDVAAIEAHDAKVRPFLLRIAERAAHNEDALR